MSSPTNSILALANIGRGEIILILGLLFILALFAVGFLGLIYVIVRLLVTRPPQASTPLPPDVATQNQQLRDREHLKLLAIFHFIFALKARPNREGFGSPEQTEPRQTGAGSAAAP